MNRKPPIVVDQIRVLAKSLPPKEIAAAIRLSRRRVCELAFQWNIPVVGRGKKERQALALARAAFHGIEIPSWVPPDLTAEFANIACARGEEIAASHIRMLKRQTESTSHATRV